jgi:hypothetical protein
MVLTNLAAAVAVPFRAKVKVVSARISAANSCSCCRIVSVSFIYIRVVSLMSIWF